MTDFVQIERVEDPGVLDRDAALVSVPLALLHAGGRDCAAFLHRLLTADIQSLVPGQGRHALLLTAKGQITSDIKVFMGASGEARLVVDQGLADETVTALSRFAIMDDFNCQVVGGHQALALFGPAAVSRLIAAGVAVPEGFAGASEYAHVDCGDLWLARVSGYGTQGIWIFADAPKITQVRSDLLSQGVPWLADDAGEARRIVAGTPAYGREFGGPDNPPRFPMEVGLGGAIDYDKGCYLGQEPIVRIRDRGHVNWRLAQLHFAPASLPASGDALSSPTRPAAGKVTSAARAILDPAAGPQGVALAVVHASVPDGDTGQIATAAGPVAARVCPLPSG